MERRQPETATVCVYARDIGQISHIGAPISVSARHHPPALPRGWAPSRHSCFAVVTLHTTTYNLAYLPDG